VTDLAVGRSCDGVAPARLGFVEREIGSRYQPLTSNLEIASTDAGLMLGHADRHRDRQRRAIVDDEAVGVPGNKITNSSPP
jgi:hypothetical protein